METVLLRYFSHENHENHLPHGLELSARIRYVIYSASSRPIPAGWARIHYVIFSASSEGFRAVPAEEPLFSS